MQIYVAVQPIKQQLDTALCACVDRIFLTQNAGVFTTIQGVDCFCQISSHAS